MRNERRLAELKNAKWDLSYTHDGFRSVAEGGITICKVGDVDLFPEIEQDAHLIAAAPDLLRVLEDILPYLEQVQGKDEQWQDAYDAIMKAKGESSCQP